MDTTISQQLTEVRHTANALAEHCGRLSMHSTDYEQAQQRWFRLRAEIGRLERLRLGETLRDAEEKKAVTDFMRTHRIWTVGDMPILRNARRTKMWLRRLERDPAVALRAEFVTTHFVSEEGFPSMRHTTRWVLPGRAD